MLSFYDDLRTAFIDALDDPGNREMYHNAPLCPVRAGALTARRRFSFYATELFTVDFSSNSLMREETFSYFEALDEAGAADARRD